MIEDMAAEGIAPIDGCSLFGVGNDEYISILKDVYLEKGFNRGMKEGKGLRDVLSSEKFVVGPFGSGKTHFVNQVSEIARLLGCVTSTISLTKNVDVTSTYSIYWQIVQNIRAPDSMGKGIENLLKACFERLKKVSTEQTTSEQDANALLKRLIDGFETDSEFEYDMFGRVAKYAFDSLLKNDNEMFHAAAQWIGGDFQNKDYSKLLNVQRFTHSERNFVATRVSLSLYQLIKKSGFLGTVIVFDEAEQGFTISTKKKSILYSLMLSEINQIKNLRGGAVLLLYAIHPSIKGDMMDNAALQTRVKHEFPFRRETPVSPIIEIDPPSSTREDILKELVAIGTKLTDLLYNSTDHAIPVSQQETLAAIKTLAERTIEQDASRSSRRMMVKHTCTILKSLNDNGKLLDVKEMSMSMPVPAIDEEV